MIERIYNYPASLIYTDKEDIEDYVNSKEPIDKLLVEIYQRAVDAGLCEENPVCIFNDVYRCAIIIANTHNYRMLPVLNKAIDKCFHHYQDNKLYVAIEMLKTLVCSQKWIDSDFWRHSFEMRNDSRNAGYSFSIAIPPLVEDSVENPQYNTDLSLKPISPLVLKSKGFYKQLTDWVLGNFVGVDVKWDDLIFILGNYHRKADRNMFFNIMRDSHIHHSDKSVSEIEERLANGTFNSWWCNKFALKQSETIEDKSEYIDDDIADELEKCRAENKVLRTENEKCHKQIEDYKKQFNDIAEYSGKNYMQNRAYRIEIENCHKEIEQYKAQLKRALDSKRELTGSISILQITNQFKKMLKYSSHDKVSNLFDEMNTLLGGNKVWESHKDEIVDILAQHKDSANAMSVGYNNGFIAENMNLKISPETEAKLLENTQNKH